MRGWDVDIKVLILNLYNPELHGFYLFTK